MVKDRAAVARQGLRRLDGEFRLAPQWTRASEKASPAWVAYDQVGVPVAIPVHQVRTCSAAEQRRPGTRELQADLSTGSERTVHAAFEEVHAIRLTAVGPRDQVEPAVPANPRMRLAGGKH